MKKQVGQGLVQEGADGRADVVGGGEGAGSARARARNVLPTMRRAGSEALSMAGRLASSSRIAEGLLAAEDALIGRDLEILQAAADVQRIEGRLAGERAARAEEGRLKARHIEDARRAARVAARRIADLEGAIEDLRRADTERLGDATVALPPVVQDGHVRWTGPWPPRPRVTLPPIDRDDPAPRGGRCSVPGPVPPHAHLGDGEDLS